MGFYLNVFNERIISASNNPLDEVGVASIAVSEEVYYNFITHENRYKVVAGEIVEDENFFENFKKENQERFEKDFFKTSLGNVRRKVSMKTGETKDFLSDLLPVIQAGVQAGNVVNILTYDQPDFTKEIKDEYMLTLQKQVVVDAAFIGECFNQLAQDFAG